VATITIYIPKENGDLTYVADVEDEDRPDMALDAVLDELPRIASRSDEFVALIDGFDGGQSVLLTLADPEVVERRPKRAIAMSSNGAVAETEPVEEEPLPTPRRRGGGRRQTAAAKTPPKRRAAAKTAPKRASGRKTPFTRNAKSDD
jgi:hypothetical protein